MPNLHSDAPWHLPQLRLVTMAKAKKTCSMATTSAKVSHAKAERKVGTSRVWTTLAAAMA